MPKISLVICLYKERDLLERLLSQCSGCYDDLVVVHDGPEYQFLREKKQIHERDHELMQKYTVEYARDWQSPEALSLKEPQAPPIELAKDYADLSPDALIPTGYRRVSGSPRSGSVHELVVSYGGRFFEGPRCFQQEPHWPFSWWAARHDWILKLDADEFPSDSLKQWLVKFRNDHIAIRGISGYTSIWPLWNGVSQETTNIPEWRLFVIDRRDISYVGMAEQVPEMASLIKKTGLILNHIPNRKSFGLSNILARNQAYNWRKIISLSIMNSALLMPRWNYQSHLWPYHWEQIKKNPLRTGVKRFIKAFINDLVNRPKSGHKILIEETIGTATHQLLMAWTFFYYRFINGIIFRANKSKSL
jgi:glycosyltransferase involved in cell wall biosynthesis